MHVHTALLTSNHHADYRTVPWATFTHYHRKSRHTAAQYNPEPALVSFLPITRLQISYNVHDFQQEKQAHTPAQHTSEPALSSFPVFT
jgi:hypothetical protein